MKKIKIVLMGYGNVGRYFVRLLHEKKETIKNLGLELTLTGVVGRNTGIINTEGLDTERFIYSCDKRLEGDAKFCGLHGLIASGADIMVEATPTDLKNGRPALDHIMTALQKGMHVVTLNKGPLVVEFQKLKRTARETGTQLKISGATAAALPTMDVAEYSLAGADILSIEGIFNGTTNYILSAMFEDNKTSDTALREAQEKGIAEADPSLDLSGQDTAAKICILANAIFDAGIMLSDIKISGITEIGTQEVKAAKNKNKVIKLVGTVRKNNGKVEAEVKPVHLEPDHALARINGTQKAILYKTDTMGDIFVTGGVSSPRGAAAAALKDIINIGRQLIS